MAFPCLDGLPYCRFAKSAWPDIDTIRGQANGAFAAAKLSTIADRNPGFRPGEADAVEILGEYQS